MPDPCSRYDRMRVEFLRGFFPRGAGRGLDVGCFDGTTTAMLDGLGYDVVGIDVDESAIKSANARWPALEFEQRDAGQVQELGKFSVVQCLEVIEHIPADHQQAFIRRLAGALDDGGRLFISSPGRWSLYSMYERARWRLRGRRGYDWWDPTHVAVLSARRLERLLEDADLVVEASAGFHYLPERLCPPFGVTARPLTRAGFDLIYVARRR